MNLTNRKNGMLSFINALEAEKREAEANKSILNDPLIKERKLSDSIKECKHAIVTKVFGDLYINALPLDQDYKDANCSELKSKMSEFIDNNGGTDFITERMRKTNSYALKTILETADKIAMKYENECRNNFDKLTVENLNYHMSDDDEKYIDRITQDLRLDDVSDIIQQQVQSTLDDEIERSRFEEEDKQMLQSRLEEDETITSESAIEDAIRTHYMGRENKIYQPSLFESILLCESTKESDPDIALGNTLVEYTIHSVANTMKLKDYDIESTIALSNKYRE